MPLIFCKVACSPELVSSDLGEKVKKVLDDLPGNYSHWFMGEGVHTGLFLQEGEKGLYAFDLSNNWICVIDGRIDNLREVGLKFGCASLFDSENIARSVNILWQRVGGDLLVDLIGDFSVVFLNTTKKVAYLARDPAGTRPLYYFSCKGVLTVASDLRLIKVVNSVKFRLNESGASRMLIYGSHGSLRPSETFIEGVRRVVPGEIVSWQSGRLARKRFWDPRGKGRYVNLSFEEAAEELDRRIQVAVARRAKFEVGMGAHVSGGLDCSSVASYLAKLAFEKGDRMLGFSWTPADSVDPGSTELLRISAISKKNGFKVCFPKGADYRASKRERSKLAFDFWRPWQDMEFEYEVQRCAASAGVRHLMSGWGGDEFASGYGNSAASDLAIHLRWIELYNLVRRVRTANPIRGRLGFVLRNILFDPVRESLPRVSRSGFVCDGCRRGKVALILPSERLVDGVSVVQAQWQRYISGYIFDRIESWYQFGKRFGIEYSYPLLDRDVLEFVFRLPPEFFFDGRTRRKVFRKAVERFWPTDLIWKAAKSEPGLMGFVGAGSQRQSSSLEHELFCLSGPEEALKYVDREIVKDVFGRIQNGCAKVTDLFFLARIEKVLRSMSSLN